MVNLSKIMERFLSPGFYVRWWDIDKKKFTFLKLLEREAPLKYPYTFAALTAGSTSTETFFNELDPSKRHIYQIFLGVRPGVKVYIWSPYDEKRLKWDEDISDIEEDETATVEYEDSPYEDPQFQLWVIRDRYPGLKIKNIINRTLYPQIIFIGAKFNYEEVTDTEILDKLKRGVIKSTPITWRKIE